jgi:chromate reductase, NAD(P)H dehydrogenase (quinone)
MRILAINGSLQADSSNLALLQAAMAAAPPGVEVVLSDGMRELPHFNLDLEATEPVAAVEAWRRAIEASDALLIACPEYGFSLPGALKNAIDWVIGSGELEQKIVAITASVAHAARGRRGLKALAEPLSAVSATIVGGVPIARGPSFDEEVRALLMDIVSAVEAHQDPGRAAGAVPPSSSPSSKRPAP